MYSRGSKLRKNINDLTPIVFQVINAVGNSSAAEINILRITEFGGLGFPLIFFYVASTEGCFHEKKISY